MCAVILLRVQGDGGWALGRQVLWGGWVVKEHVGAALVELLWLLLASVVAAQTVPTLRPTGISNRH